MTESSRVIPIAKALVVIGGLIVIAGTCPANRVTFDVSAETDFVVYEPDQDSTRRYSWELDSAEYRVNQSGTSSEFRVLSGTLHFLPPVIVSVSRRSIGSLHIRLDVPEFHPAPVVGFFDPDSLPPIPLSGGALFTLPAVETRAGRGDPVVLPVRGTLTIGSGASNGGKHPVGVREGSIDLLSAALFKDTSVLVVRSVELRAGDTFRVSQSDSSGWGILAADERPLINVAYRALGKEARIERIHGKTRSLTASKSDVWVSDPFFRVVASFVLILVTLSFGSVRARLRRLRSSVPALVRQLRPTHDPGDT